MGPISICWLGFLHGFYERVVEMYQGLIEQFWSHGKDLHEEGKFKSALNQLLREFRKTVDDSSPLAKSIDNNDSSRKMAIIANKESYSQLGEILFLDTEEGDQRQEERRDTLGRRHEDRRRSLLMTALDKREAARRSKARRDPASERRGN